MPTARQAFSGLEELSKVLRGISAQMRARLLEPAVGKAAEPIRMESAARAPRRTGALAKSIAIKTLRDENRGTAVALIGPDRNYYVGGVKTSARTARAAGFAGHTADKPANYAHLVEFGHAVVGKGHAQTKAQRKANLGGGTTMVPAKPFMRPGFFAGAPKAEEILARELSNGMEKVRSELVA